MIRLYIADDHTILRQGLRRPLREAPDMAISAGAAMVVRRWLRKVSEAGSATGGKGP